MKFQILSKFNQLIYCKDISHVHIHKACKYKNTIIVYNILKLI